MSKGLLDLSARGVVRVLSTVSPFVKPMSAKGLGGRGLCARDEFLLPSPSRTNVSTDFSTLPSSPRSTCMFLLSSGNPISLRYAIFVSKPSSRLPPTSAPKNLAGFLSFGGGDGSRPNPLSPGETGGLSVLDRTGKVEDAARRLGKWNLLLGFGGRGGGRSSELVLPVFWRDPGAESPANILCSYFCLMKRSITPSTSSASTGIAGFVFRGL
jgi:hypothetical protein